MVIRFWYPFLLGSLLIAIQLTYFSHLFFICPLGFMSGVVWWRPDLTAENTYRKRCICKCFQAHLRHYLMCNLSVVTRWTHTFYAKPPSCIFVVKPSLKSLSTKAKDTSLVMRRLILWHRTPTRYSWTTGHYHCYCYYSYYHYYCYCCYYYHFRLLLNCCSHRLKMCDFRIITVSKSFIELYFTITRMSYMITAEKMKFSID